MTAKVTALLTVSVLTSVVTLLPTRPITAAVNCGVTSLHGSYAYSADGYVTQTPNQPPFTPIAEAGVFRFDGAGHFVTTNTISVGGLIIPRSATGTYTVEADCTGSGDVTGGASFNFAITRAAQSIRFVVSTPGVSVIGVMDKQ